MAVTSGFIRDTKAAGLDLYVWTVDDTHHAENMIALGVDGITTNKAGFLRNIINSKIKFTQIQSENNSYENTSISYEDNSILRTMHSYSEKETDTILYLLSVYITEKLVSVSE